MFIPQPPLERRLYWLRRYSIERIAHVQAAEDSRKLHAEKLR